MHELMIFLAKEMPEDALIDQLSEAMAKYKADPTKENKSFLGSICMLMTIRLGSEGTDTMALIEKTAKSKQLLSVLDKERLG
jgi:hypothetical protein